MVAVGLMAVTSVAFAEGPSRGHDRAGRAAERSERAERTPSPERSDAESGSRSSAGLSPEERRQLRRDVQQAGRDIYTERGAGSGNERRNRRQQER